MPDRALKIGTIRRQRNVEGAALAFEILCELAFDTFERFVEAFPIAFGFARLVAARKADDFERVTAAREKQRSDRAFHVAVEHQAAFTRAAAADAQMYITA